LLVGGLRILVRTSVSIMILTSDFLSDRRGLNMSAAQDHENPTDK